jgi:hypothetical protein
VRVEKVGTIRSPTIELRGDHARRRRNSGIASAIIAQAAGSGMGVSSSACVSPVPGIRPITKSLAGRTGAEDARWNDVDHASGGAPVECFLVTARDDGVPGDLPIFADRVRHRTGQAKVANVGNGITHLSPCHVAGHDRRQNDEDLEPAHALVSPMRSISRPINLA